MESHKTAAWPLAQVYLGLIVYASLYPFGPWRDQGIPPWSFLSLPWPAYWVGFDVVANVLGYIPLSFLLVVSALRTGRGRWVMWLAMLPPMVLSLVLESCQMYLPTRVASRLDFMLNVGGAFLGGLLAWILEKGGWLQRWSRFRASWFVQDARGALVLLALWPLALLFPTTLPFGLGQVIERLELALGTLLQHSPFIDWLPLRDIELQPLLPLTRFACVVLGLLIPGLLGYSVTRPGVKRSWFVVGLLVTGCAAVTLSSALSFGPQHAWVWWTTSMQYSVLIAAVLLLLSLAMAARTASALALLMLGVYLSLINQSGSGPYFEQTLFLWEQGRFIRFYGVAQWLGWLWPYACLAYLLARVAGRDRAA